MNKEYLKTLHTMPIFAGLSDDTIDYLFSEAKLIKRAKGDYFFHESDKGHDLYIIQHGAAVVVKSWENIEYILAQLHFGDCFGEMELIDICPHSASVIAAEDSEVIVIKHNSITHLLEKSLEEYAIIMMNMGREVSRRLRTANEIILEENIKSGNLKRYLE
jgi:CRP/FNR family transcriptional regulator, cyclic AMP receptor protein